MSPIITPKSLIKPSRTKEESNKTMSMKKQLFKQTDENKDKENSQPSTPKTSLLSMALTQQKTPPTTPSKNNMRVQNISFANMKFSHLHRISYTALLSMLRTCMSCSGDQHSDELVSDDKLDVLVDLITSSSFIDYLEQIVETKLIELNKARNIQTIFVYDTESLEPAKRLDFLTSLFE
jgi:hypothetical protein